jgi:hypothetical protein
MKLNFHKINSNFHQLIVTTNAQKCGAQVSQIQESSSCDVQIDKVRKIYVNLVVNP